MCVRDDIARLTHAQTFKNRCTNRPDVHIENSEKKKSLYKWSVDWLRLHGVKTIVIV